MRAVLAAWLAVATVPVPVAHAKAPSGPVRGAERAHFADRWLVIVASDADETKVTAQAAARKPPAKVLRADDFEGLRGGLFVVVASAHASREAAEAARKGEAGAYVTPASTKGSKKSSARTSVAAIR